MPKTDKAVTANEFAEVIHYAKGHYGHRVFDDRYMASDLVMLSELAKVLSVTTGESIQEEDTENIFQIMLTLFSELASARDWCNVFNPVTNDWYCGEGNPVAKASIIYSMLSTIRHAKCEWFDFESWKELRKADRSLISFSLRVSDTWADIYDHCMVNGLYFEEIAVSVTRAVCGYFGEGDRGEASIFVSSPEKSALTSTGELRSNGVMFSKRFILEPKRIHNGRFIEFEGEAGDTTRRLFLGEINYGMKPDEWVRKIIPKLKPDQVL